MKFADLAARAGIAVIGLCSPLEADPFDPALWQDLDRIHAAPYPRQGMLETLLADHLHPGLTREAVIALLGQPPRTGYFADYDLVYFLGPEPGWVTVDSQWLLLRFDSADLLSHISVATD